MADHAWTSVDEALAAYSRYYPNEGKELREAATLLGSHYGRMLVARFAYVDHGRVGRHVIDFMIDGRTRFALTGGFQGKLELHPVEPLVAGGPPHYRNSYSTMITIDVNQDAAWPLTLLNTVEDDLRKKLPAVAGDAVVKSEDYESDGGWGVDLFG